MLVYRLETPDGNGPYRNGPKGSTNLFTDVNMDDDDDLHPAPRKDKYFGYWWDQQSSHTTSQYHFGFDSIEQMKRWLQCTDSEQRKELHERGLYIALYEASEYKQGYSQLIFIKSTAKFMRYQYLVDIDFEAHG